MIFILFSNPTANNLQLLHLTLRRTYSEHRTASHKQSPKYTPEFWFHLAAGHVTEK